MSADGCGGRVAIALLGDDSKTLLSHIFLFSFLLATPGSMHTHVLKSLQSCDPMDCKQAGSSVHGILQARILEWVAMFIWDLNSPTQG